jgi:hypothetical protein
VLAVEAKLDTGKCDSSTGQQALANFYTMEMVKRWSQQKREFCAANFHRCLLWLTLAKRALLQGLHAGRENDGGFRFLKFLVRRV